MGARLGSKTAACLDKMASDFIGGLSTTLPSFSNTNKFCIEAWKASYFASEFTGDPGFFNELCKHAEKNPLDLQIEGVAAIMYAIDEYISTGDCLRSCNGEAVAVRLAAIKTAELSLASALARYRDVTPQTINATRKLLSLTPSLARNLAEEFGSADDEDGPWTAPEV
ncbi:MAG: hypothetical protein ACR650_09995 [Methylocystis sp.]|jgi:hypothetical protein